MGKVFIAAQHGNIHSMSGKYTANVLPKTGTQGSGYHLKTGNRLGESQMNTGKALLPRPCRPFLQRPLLHIMEPYSKLQQCRHSFQN